MEEKFLRPKIRFKGFTDAWEQYKLEDVCQYIVAGGDIEKELIKEEGQYPVIANALTNDGIVGYYDSYYRIEAPALTVTGRGDIGHAQARKANFTPVVRLLTAKTHHDVDFLENAINLRGFVVESTGVPQLTVPKLKGLELLIPKDKTEELLIGKFFVDIDNLITLHQRKYDKLVNTKKALLDKMFPKNGELVPKLRFRGFTDAWEQYKLKQVTVYKNGKGHEHLQSDIGDYELINLNSISIDGGLKPSGRFVSYSDDTLSKDDLVMVLSDVAHGDLLGRVALIPENNKYVLNQRVALLRPNGVLNPNYLYYIINNHQNYFKLQGAGSSQLNISKDSVENFSFLAPNSHEQSDLTLFFDKIDNLITLHQRKYEKLKNIKKALLEKIFV